MTKGEVSDYFKRTGTPMPDGRISMASKRDLALEKAVMGVLGFVWKLKMGSFGRFAPLDFDGFRDGKLVGIMELKTHPYPIEKYPTTQLNLRKWGWLQLYQGLGVKTLLLKLWENELYFIETDKIGAHVDKNIVMGGCHKWFKSCTDQEPIIQIPTHEFKYVCQVLSTEEYEKIKALDEQNRYDRMVSNAKPVKQLYAKGKKFTPKHKNT